MRQQRVSVSQIREGVDRDCRDLKVAAEGALVERFDVLQLVHILEIVRVYTPRSQRVEHERVIAVGTVRDADDSRCHRLLRRAAANAATISSWWRSYSGSAFVASVRWAATKRCSRRCLAAESPRS